jgi:ribonuclease R
LPSRFTHRILEHLAHTGYEPAAPRAIAADMQVREEDLAAFDEAVTKLLAEEKVLADKHGRLALPAMGDEVIGRLRVNPRGFGFVIPESTYREGDLFIPPDGLRDAVTGDRVRARVLRREAGRGPGRGREREREGRLFGRVVEVLERGQEHFVGMLAKQGTQWVVHPDGRELLDPVVIRDPHAKNAREGDKVVIELLHYPSDRYLSEGVITRVLGPAGRPDVETAAVIAAHGLRSEFSPQVLAQARESARGFDAEEAGPWAGREDLTETLTFTIDPPDARDYDDAISVEHDAGNDRYILGVHIADVARFVSQGSPLDQEATLRGNSVYLPRVVLPMLPEVLSNGVCSLQEGVPRFTLSAFVTLGPRGDVLGQRLAATVIRSRKRLTYLEAQALIDGDLALAAQHSKSGGEYPPALVENLRLADRLAKILRQRRLRHGMIVLNLPSVELVFDEQGHVIDAVPEDNAFTHTLIEMFMVEANEAVARAFSSLNLPLLRRIHPDPVHGDLEELRMYARAAHFDLPARPTRSDLQRLLDATRETPAARAVHFAVLRTLTRATYSPALIGHYALASDHYAHFTSPIRRYPDLTVHRALHALLDATNNDAAALTGRRAEKIAKKIVKDARVLDEGRLIELGRHCTDTENEAEKAEEELRDFLVLQFLREKHLGDVFTGVITAVTRRGIFVSIERFLVEGVVKIEDLPAGGADAGGPRRGSSRSAGGGGGRRAERWVVNEDTGRLTARGSGLSLGVGDVVSVQIVTVDETSRHMELLITALPPPPGERAEAGTRRPGQRKREGRGKPARLRQRGKTARRGKRR